MEILQQTNCNGFVLKDCMPELQVLMTHLDNLIIEKQAKWQIELQSARNELDLRNTQLTQAKVKLEQKDVEMKTLELKSKTKLESKANIINQYDVELTNLKTQLKSLKQNHQEMNERRALKQKDICNREKELQTEYNDLRLELDQKSVFIAKHQKEKSEWEISKKSLKTQLECMERQKEAILNNYENCRNILSEVRNELKHTKEEKDKIDNNNRTKIQKLEEELISNKKLIQKQDILNVSLQKRLKDSESERHHQNERIRMREENDMSSSRMIVLEEENKRLSDYLSIKEDSIKLSEAKIADLKHTIEVLEEKLSNKQAEIVESEGKVKNAAERARYEKRISELQENLTSVRSSEASMKDQVLFLERQLDKSSDRVATARCLNSCENDKIERLTEELKTLHKKLQNMEKSHTSQLEFIKSEIGKLVKKGGTRDVEKLTKTCAEMEKRLGDEASRRKKLNKELEDVTKNFQSIQQGGSSDCKEVDCSLHEVERSLLKLRRGYQKADSNLKKENSILKDQVTTLRKIGLKKDKRRQNTQQQQQSISFQNITSSTPRSPNRRSNSYDSSSTYSYDSSSNSSNNDPRNNDSCEDITTRHLRTPTPTREFLRSIGFYSTPASSFESLPEGNLTRVTSQNRDDSGNTITQDDQNNQTGLSMSMGQISDNAKSHLLRSYVAGDMERTTEMQKRIESHIEEVERAMTNVMDKYFTKDVH